MGAPTSNIQQHPKMAVMLLWPFMGTERGMLVPEASPPQPRKP